MPEFGDPARVLVSGYTIRLFQNSATYLQLQDGFVGEEQIAVGLVTSRNNMEDSLGISFLADTTQIGCSSPIQQ